MRPTLVFDPNTDAGDVVQSDQIPEDFKGLVHPIGNGQCRIVPMEWVRGYHAIELAPGSYFQGVDIIDCGRVGSMEDESLATAARLAHQKLQEVRQLNEDENARPLSVEWMESHREINAASQAYHDALQALWAKIGPFSP